MTIRRALSLALALASALVAVARAAEPPAGVRLAAEVEGIREFALANGLRVLLFPDPSKTTVTVNITYLVGSRHEGYGESGMAHLLEHLVFKGSRNHPNIPQELTAHGTRPNGSTWYDRTNYFETMDATDENLAWALDLESDRMVNCFVRAEDLASEFSVVRNEFEAGENDPRGVLLERVMSTAYLWHNYGKSTIGSRADIERVPIANLKAFYEKWYRPDNAILIVAGRLDEARTLGWIVEKFGPIANPPTPLDSTWTVEPAQDGPREVTLRRVGGVQALWAAGTCRRHRTRSRRRSTCSPRSSATNRTAGCTGSWSRAVWRPRWPVSTSPSTTRGCCSLTPRPAKRPTSRRSKRSSSRWSRGRRRAASPTKRSSAPAALCSAAGRRPSATRSGSPSGSPSGRRAATGACSSCTATGSRR
jgi:hypothetical protein